MGDEGPTPSISIDSLVAGAAGLATLAHPVGLTIAAAAAAPVVAAKVKIVVRRIAERRLNRQETLIRYAAGIAGIDPDELDARCASEPELDELLTVVLAAAGDTATREKIITYAMMLGQAVQSPGAEYRWETAFVRVIRDLEPVNIELLNRFTRTSNELGLGDGPDFDAPPQSLNDKQLALIAEDFLPTLPLALATLQRHGLLAHEFAAGGLVGRGSTYGFWVLTDFGREVNRLLKTLRDGLTSAPPPSTNSGSG